MTVNFKFIILSWLFVSINLLAESKSVSDQQQPTNFYNIDKETNNTDPWENFNRKIFSFNEVLDDNILRPIAHAYKNNIPSTIQTGIGNWFNNLDDIFVVLNDLLQFKPIQMGQDITRFVINSTIGFFGFFDVSSHIGLTKHQEDFGLTLAVWGVSDGPYIVLPFFGPSSVRNLTGRISTWSMADIKSSDGTYVINPIKNIDSSTGQNTLFIINKIDERAGLLESENTLNLISLDKYATIRDVYLSYRQFLATDGKLGETMENSLSEDLTEDSANIDDIDAMLEEDDDL